MRADKDRGELARRRRRLWPVARPGSGAFLPRLDERAARPTSDRPPAVGSELHSDRTGGGQLTREAIDAQLRRLKLNDDDEDEDEDDDGEDEPEPGKPIGEDHQASRRAGHPQAPAGQEQQQQRRPDPQGRFQRQVWMLLATTGQEAHRQQVAEELDERLAGSLPSSSTATPPAVVVAATANSFQQQQEPQQQQQQPIPVLVGPANEHQYLAHPQQVAAPNFGHHYPTHLAGPAYVQHQQVYYYGPTSVAAAAPPNYNACNHLQQQHHHHANQFGQAAELGLHHQQHQQHQQHHQQHLNQHLGPHQDPSLAELHNLDGDRDAPLHLEERTGAGEQHRRLPESVIRVNERARRTDTSGKSLETFHAHFDGSSGSGSRLRSTASEFTTLNSVASTSAGSAGAHLYGLNVSAATHSNSSSNLSPGSHRLPGLLVGPQRASAEHQAQRDQQLEREEQEFEDRRQRARRTNRAPRRARGRTRGVAHNNHLEDGRQQQDDEQDDEEYYVCEWQGCSNTFLEMKAFVRHLEESHVNQEPAEKNRFFCLWTNCKRNNQEFNARYKLLIHMRVHSGEKPFSCDVTSNCTKSFSRLENLKIHKRSHTGEKPYVCKQRNCSKSFTNSSDRIKHHKTHVDPKPYNCTHEGCTKRYTDPSSLRKHLRAHKRHGDDPRELGQPMGHFTTSVAQYDQQYSASHQSEQRLEVDQYQEPAAPVLNGSFHESYTKPYANSYMINQQQQPFLDAQYDPEAELIANNDLFSQSSGPPPVQRQQQQQQQAHERLSSSFSRQHSQERGFHQAENQPTGYEPARAAQMQKSRSQTELQARHQQFSSSWCVGSRPTQHQTAAGPQYGAAAQQQVQQRAPPRREFARQDWPGQGAWPQQEVASQQASYVADSNQQFQMQTSDLGGGQQSNWQASSYEDERGVVLVEPQQQFDVPHSGQWPPPPPTTTTGSGRAPLTREEQHERLGQSMPVRFSYC